MKQIALSLAFLAFGWSTTYAAPEGDTPPAAGSLLVIEPSSMPVAGGKATLTIGTLKRVKGVYEGAYKMTVSPYFFKNEKGSLAIVVPDESLAKIAAGKVANVVGTAITSGKDGASRHVDAIAMPSGTNGGKIKLWFLAGDRQMVFEPAYHFAEKESAAAGARTAAPRPASNVKHPLSAPNGETQEAASQ
jgi:hypothetical protein